VPIVFWIAVAVLVAAIIVGAVHVFLRARAFTRVFRVFSADADETVRRLNRKLDQLERETAAFEERRPRLEASIARLKVSVARLNVLRGAVQEVQDSINKLTAFFPRA
jgi:hypothetical protein